ncbi:MAG: hypothetical protein ACIAQZ_03995 [Sedimentisphaeraceae bacterium JB056]
MISKILLWLGGFVGAVVLLAVVAYFWLATGEPTIDHDYLAELNEFIKPEFEIKDEENAATFFDNAAEVYSPFPEQEDEFDPISLDFFVISSDQEKLVCRWIEENKEAMELWREGSEKKYYWREYSLIENAPLTDIELPNLGITRKMIYSFLWQSYFALSDGDFTEGIDDLKVVFRTAAHIKSQKTLIEQIVGIALARCASDAACLFIQEFDLSREELTEIKNELEISSAQIGKPLDIESERYMMLDGIQRSFVVTPIGDHWYPESFNGSDNAFLKNEPESFTDFMKIVFFPPGKQECMDDAAVLYKSVDSNYRKPPYVVGSYEEAVAAEVGENFMFATVKPFLSQVAYLVWRTNDSNEASILVVDLHLFKIDNGYFPESLNQLVDEGYIDQLPIDSFSGKSFIYSRQVDSFLLYGIGEDGVDDGGEDYDAVFWPIK